MLIANALPVPRAFSTSASIAVRFGETEANKQEGLLKQRPQPAQSAELFRINPNALTTAECQSLRQLFDTIFPEHTTGSSSTLKERPDRHLVDLKASVGADNQVTLTWQAASSALLGKDALTTKDFSSQIKHLFEKLCQQAIRETLALSPRSCPLGQTGQTKQFSVQPLLIREYVPYGKAMDQSYPHHDGKYATALVYLSDPAQTGWSGREFSFYGLDYGVTHRYQPTAGTLTTFLDTRTFLSNPCEPKVVDTNCMFFQRHGVTALKHNNAHNTPITRDFIAFAIMPERLPVRLSSKKT